MNYRPTPTQAGSTTAEAAVPAAPVRRRSTIASRRRVLSERRTLALSGAASPLPSPPKEEREEPPQLASPPKLSGRSPAAPRFPLSSPGREERGEEAPTEPHSLEDVELKLLLEAVYLQSGFEFRNYHRPLIKQRVVDSVRRERLKTISELQAAVLRESPVLERLLVCFTEHRTCPFAEPAFYRAFRQEIVPWLRTYPFARIWVVGCAGGAETYSLATVLLEEGLQERCRIYATDLCEAVVRQARAGYWPLPRFKRAAAHYRSAGGTQDFSRYYTLQNGQAHISAALAKNIVFAAHNLMTDASFNEFHVVLCREAMAQFDPILQAQVHQLLYGSLVPRGVLALGRRHELGLTLYQSDYEAILPRHGIYRKKWPN